MRSHFQTVFLALGAALLTTPIARAEITKFVNDFDGWQAAASSFTTVDFVENAPPASVLFDHFIDYGVLLHRPGSFNPAIPYWGRFTNQDSNYIHDAGGLAAAVPHAFRFLAPIHAFAYLPLSYGGGDAVSLYLGGNFVANVVDPGQPIGLFRGLHSTSAFDEVRFSSILYLDDIYFQTVPAPGALALIALAAPLAGTRRRR
jgi:hypothetical protein